jgi:hypothetical protein
MLLAAAYEAVRNLRPFLRRRRKLAVVALVLLGVMIGLGGWNRRGSNSRSPEDPRHHQTATLGLWIPQTLALVKAAATNSSGAPAPVSVAAYVRAAAAEARDPASVWRQPRRRRQQGDAPSAAERYWVAHPHQWLCVDRPAHCDAPHCVAEGGRWALCPSAPPNPNVVAAHDNGRLARMVHATVVLALHVALGDDRDGASAAALAAHLHTALVDEATRLPPQLARVGDADISTTAATDASEAALAWHATGAPYDELARLPELLEALALVGTEVLPPATAAGVRAWLRALLSTTLHDVGEATTVAGRAWHTACRVALRAWLDGADAARQEAAAALLSVVQDLHTITVATPAATLDAVTMAVHMVMRALGHHDASTHPDGPIALAPLRRPLSSVPTLLGLRPVTLRLLARWFDDVAPLQAAAAQADGAAGTDPAGGGGSTVAMLVSSPSALLWSAPGAMHAIAFVYHRDAVQAAAAAAAAESPTLDPNLCALVANAALLRQTVQAAAAAGHGPAAVDLVLITDASETSFLTARERQLLVEVLGVRIVHSPAWRAFNATGNVVCTGSQRDLAFQRLNILKIEAFCLPSYRAVYYTDLDNFVSDFQPDFWALVEESKDARPGPPPTCVGRGGATAPFVGHEFMAVPSPASCQRLRTALAGGFTPETGWGGHGPMPVWASCRCPLATSEKFCASLGMPLVADGPYPRACHTSSGLMNWNFYGSCTDQGILYWECALASKTGWVPETIDPFYRKRAAEHHFGSEKPWRAATHATSYQSRAPVPKIKLFRTAVDAAVAIVPSFLTWCPTFASPTRNEGDLESRSL